MLTGMRRLSPIDLRNASTLEGCIYLYQDGVMISNHKCGFYNAHHISERRAMLTQSLPAASLRTGHRLPAARLLLRVSNYLIYMVLWLSDRRVRTSNRVFSLLSGRRQAGRHCDQRR